MTMKAIRTYAKGQNISYQFPSTDKQWTVQFSNNIKSIQLVGKTYNGNTADQLRGVQQLNANLSCLDSYCFNKAANIENIYLSPQIASINERCFNECTNVKAISYDIYETCEAPAGESETPQLRHIGNYAFAQCAGMHSITLPESIDSISKIDTLAFADSNLTSVTFMGISASQLGC